MDGTSQDGTKHYSAINLMKLHRMNTLGWQLKAKIYIWGTNNLWAIDLKHQLPLIRVEKLQK
jgi:hypothetical protein